MISIRKETKWPWIAPVLLATIVFQATGCTESDPGEPAPEINAVTAKHALTRFDECRAFERYAKRAAIEYMTAEIELERKWMYEELKYRGSTNGDDVSIGVDASSGADADADGDVDFAQADMGNESFAEGAAAPGAAGTDGNDGDYTQTNTQEKGVDEADFIKTNGDYLFVTSGTDLVIVQVLDNGGLEEVGRLAVGGRPDEMFLYEDLVIMFSTLDQGGVPEGIRLPESPRGDDVYYGSGPEIDGDGDLMVADVDMAPDMAMTYCEPGSYCGGSGYTQIAVIDVADPTAPTITRAVTYAGSYVSSRRIGGAVRAVISSPINGLNLPMWVDWYQYYDKPTATARRLANRDFNNRIKENKALIEAMTLDQILPKKIDTAEGSEPEYISSCEDIYGPFTPAGLGLVSVVSLDLEDPSFDQAAVSVLGQRGLVYASTTSLYLTTSNDYVGEAWRSGIWDAETSGIHKFDISSDATTAVYRGTGTAPGRMLDQFCLGEHDGFLRVATTTGNAWGDPWASGEGNTLDNHIVIFEEKNGVINSVSRIDGIGVDEEIYAARFVGDRGFLVTFLQTDPLFTFDLSDPYNPKVVGEWLGPGYSTYLHPYGDNHLIAMGRDEQWRVTMTLYDVTDFAKPEMVERLPLDPQLNSAAVDQHKAFTFVESDNLLSIPYDGWQYNGRQDRFMTGILLFDLDPNEGFTEAGDLVLRNTDQYEAAATRSVFIDDVLYGISSCRITSAALSAPGDALDSLPLYAGTSCSDFNYLY
jgi:hypothetical protein